jgi:hypothetical protein
MVEILIKRSTVAGKAPTALRTGELAVNIPDKKIWIGDAAGDAALLLNAAAYLPLAGGTMTGTINVPNGINAFNTASGFNIIGSAAGLTVRFNTTNLLAYGVNQIDAYKPIGLPADPINPLQAATKQYVDNKLSTALLPTPTPTRLGGVFSGEATPGNVMYGIDTAGAPIFKQIAVPYPSATTLGGVKSAGPNANQYVSGVDTFGALTFGDLPAGAEPYVLPPAKSSVLGGIYANVPAVNTDNEFVRGVDESGQLLFGNVVFPPAAEPYVLPTASATVLGGVKIGANLSIDASGVLSASGGTTYTLPTASATVLGGIKIGTGLTVSADGTVTATLAGNYVNKAGDVMNGMLRFAATTAANGFNGADVYLYYDGTYYRCVMPGGGQSMLIEAETGNVTFPNAVSITKTLTMGNTIKLPTTVAGLTFGTSGYNVFGASGGIAVRSNNTNISNFTGANITNFVPLVTPGSGNGIQFGSGGAAFSRGSAATKIAASGAIELPTTAPAAGEAVRKDYVDGRVIAQAAGGAAPSTTGLSAGTLWIEY